LKIEAKNLRESKTSNVAITIDKVMHVLEAMQTTESPIKLLSFEERYLRFWVNDSSLKNSLISILELIEPCTEVKACLNLVKKPLDS